MVIINKEPLKESQCHKCMVDKGYKLRDNGVHTARLMKCDGCGKQKSILPLRHWVIDNSKSGEKK